MCPDPFQQVSHEQEQQRIRQQQMAGYQQQQQRMQQQALRRRRFAERPLRSDQALPTAWGWQPSAQPIAPPLQEPEPQEIPTSGPLSARKVVRFGLLVIFVLAVTGLVMSLPDFGWLYGAAAVVFLWLAMRLRPDR